VDAPFPSCSRPQLAAFDRFAAGRGGQWRHTNHWPKRSGHRSGLQVLPKVSWIQRISLPHALVFAARSSFKTRIAVSFLFGRLRCYVSDKRTTRTSSHYNMFQTNWGKRHFDLRIKKVLGIWDSPVCTNFIVLFRNTETRRTYVSLHSKVRAVPMGHSLRFLFTLTVMNSTTFF
jgi:hypothetical protein